MICMRSCKSEVGTTIEEQNRKMCVCVCVCVRMRERERQRERERERERDNTPNQSEMVLLQVHSLKGALDVPPNLRSVRPHVMHASDEGVALAKTRLEMLWRPDALELSVHHDGESGAECLALLHRVRSEDYGTVLLEHLKQSIPQEATRTRIHS